MIWSRMWNGILRENMGLIQWIVAAALEKNCIAVIGEPVIDDTLVKMFSANIIRPAILFNLG